MNQIMCADITIFALKLISCTVYITYRLAVCEKALAEYLETKRLAFPRFYFVSSADLLDILSKGNQPVEVNRTHASSCM